jgi:aspartate-semialdehyde dehydrogenase
MKRLGFLGIAGTVSTAYIGQRALLKLQDHPELETVAFIADDPADVGKTLAEAVEGRWQAEEPLPARFADLPMLSPETDQIRTAELDMVISTLFGPTSRALDPKLAAAGIAVVSESTGMRLEPDVPLVVPEINADHLDIIRAQQANRGFDRGFIVSSPLCTAVIIALAMKPFADAFGMESGVVTTLQALSGAGKKGVYSMAILDNLLPHINQEEEKLYTEVPKILGRYADGRIHDHPARVAYTATRVPVRDGHTISLSLGLEKPWNAEDLPELIEGFRGRPQELGLASSWPQPLHYRPEVDRPQPLLDRDVDGSMAVSIGRLRPAPTFSNGLSMIAVGHNHGRGTYGNTVLLAELLLGEGLLG